jgi:hypothetical protein
VEAASVDRMSVRWKVSANNKLEVYASFLRFAINLQKIKKWAHKGQPFSNH